MQDNLRQVSAYTGKLLRDIFGRGPTHCHANLSLPFLVLYIRGFRSEMETALVEGKAFTQAYQSRVKLINDQKHKLKTEVEEIFNLYVDDLFHDWDYDTNTGVIIFTFLDDDEGFGEDFPKAQSLKDEIKSVSDTKEKLPDSSKVYQITDQIYIAERKGILTYVEKSLINEGFQLQLEEIKKEVEKKFFTQKINYKKTFGKSLRKIFISLNLKEDKSYICFFLNSESQ